MSRSRDGVVPRRLSAGLPFVCCGSNPNEDEDADLSGSGVEPKCHDCRNGGGAEAFSSIIVHKVEKTPTVFISLSL